LLCTQPRRHVFVGGGTTVNEEETSINTMQTAVGEKSLQEKQDEGNKLSKVFARSAFPNLKH